MITNQAYLFLIFVANGLIIGLLFDIFRILRRSFKTSDFITYIEDILFWILTGLTILYSIFVFNNGEIRLFMFFGIAIGITIYMLTLSSIIIKTNVAIINFFKKIILAIFNIIKLPFKYILKLIKKLFLKPISFIFINVRKNSTNLYKNVTKTIRLNKKEQHTIN